MKALGIIAFEDSSVNIEDLVISDLFQQQRLWEDIVLSTSFSVI